MWFRYAKQNIYGSIYTGRSPYYIYNYYSDIDDRLDRQFWIINGKEEDAESGDEHKGCVIEHILKKYDMEDADISELTKEEALKKGMSEEEFAVVTEQIDPIQYAVKKLGWIQLSGTYAQMNGITLEKLNDLWKILYKCYPHLFIGIMDWGETKDVKDNVDIEIEDAATGDRYKVPLKYLDEMVEEGDITDLKIYKVK